MKKQWTQTLHWIIGILGFLGSCFFLFSYVETSWRLPPFKLLFIVVALILVEVACRAERLRRACLLVGKSISRGEALWINSVGDFFAAVTPSRVGGEVSRLAALSKLRMKGGKGLTAIAAEGVVDYLSLGILLCIAIFGALLQGMRSFSLTSLITTIGLYVGIAGVFAIVFVVISKSKKIECKASDLFRRKDLLALTVIHHLVRVSLLPIIILFLDGDASFWTLLLWSFLLIYGLGLLPIPSGGGSVELAFMGIIGSTLDASVASVALLWWRGASHYFYVAAGFVITIVGVFYSRTKERRGDEFFELGSGLEPPSAQKRRIVPELFL